MDRLSKRGILSFPVFLTVSALNMWPQITFAQTSCSVEIILALDVSGSVDAIEFDLQKNGIANAFRDPEIVELIQLLPGGISASVMQWSSEYDQRVSVTWRHLQTVADMLDFAQLVEKTDRGTAGAMTAIGRALMHAENVLSDNPVSCMRSVIDISGDGLNNRGPSPTPVAETLAKQGTTINALVIVGNDPALASYFQKFVARGVGSFVQTANGYADYAQAMKQKLLRELTPTSAQADPAYPTRSIFAFMSK